MEIKPTYVSFEQAKWLKEKGYKQTPNKLHNSYYNYKGEFRGDVSDYIKAYVDEDKEKAEEYSTINAPEKWEVVEWLFLNHHIWVSVDNLIDNKFYFSIRHTNTSNYASRIGCNEEGYDSPQEAYSAAFNYLKKTI